MGKIKNLLRNKWVGFTLAALLYTLWCVLDIFKKNISTGGKVIAAVVVLLTSWVGLAVYYFYGRDHLQEWFK